MYRYLLLLDTDEEKEFFQKIYIRYKNEMFYAAFAILQNSADAEDIVHDTCKQDKEWYNNKYSIYNFFLT